MKEYNKVYVCNRFQCPLRTISPEKYVVWHHRSEGYFLRFFFFDLIYAFFMSHYEFSPLTLPFSSEGHRVWVIFLMFQRNPSCLSSAAAMMLVNSNEKGLGNV